MADEGGTIEPLAGSTAAEGAEAAPISEESN